jgi:hypothetical protein
MRKLGFILGLILIIFVTHHCSIYLHEWVHGLVAWLAGYKSHPFDIHYGSKWITLFDIDEAVPYDTIYSHGKRYIVALIAIAPIVVQMILFPVGLKLLNTQTVKKYRSLYAFVYFFTLFELAQTFSYIPIRTFAQSDDIYNFVQATHISPWLVAIPGTLFVIWGIYRMLHTEVPKAEYHLKITSKSGRIAFLVTTILLILGYYGTPGFFKSDSISPILTIISWSMVPISLILLLWKRRI